MDIRLPSLGEGADSGVVVNLLVKEGDTIQKDQPILELETEKAVGSIPSPAAGAVQQIRVKVGDKISVGQVILTLVGGVAAAVPAAPPAVPVTPKPSAPAAGTAATTPPHIPGLPLPASPTIRKLARDLGIDLSRVRGTDAGGRITMDDLRAYIQQLQQAAAAPAVAPAKLPVESVDFAQWGPVVHKPVTPLRQTIARRMSESWSAVPRVTQFDEADITALNELRKKHAAAYEAKGARLTLTGFALKAVAATLRKHPIFNASLNEANGEIVMKEYIHIGIAVDTEHGLIVPVIRNVDKKSLLELSRELETLATKARERKVTAEELKGGSFTISNQGGIGSGHFTPIVNKPEVAILGMGRGALKPVVRDGQIVPRLLLPLALSYDHRVIDGGNAARFMVDLVKALESFSEAEARL
jgi:pyruvate dehydrogenase E2 component (dihydrolipoamide acetyltransferase)